MKIQMGFVFLAAIALVSACSSSDSDGTQGAAGSGGSAGSGAAGAAGGGTATTNTFIASCAINASGIAMCTDYYDCVGADAAAIKNICVSAAGGVGSDAKCTASDGGKCTIPPSGTTPCTQVLFMPAGASNKTVCEGQKGTYTAP